MNSATVAAGTDATAAQYNNLRKDVIEQAGEYLVAGGTANAITVTTDGQLSGAPATGQRLKIKAASTNTGAVTIAQNGGSTVNVKTNGGFALIGGEILSGVIYIFDYDGTNHILLNPSQTQAPTLPAFNGMGEWMLIDLPLLKAKSGQNQWEFVSGSINAAGHRSTCSAGNNIGAITAYSDTSSGGSRAPIIDNLLNTDQSILIYDVAVTNDNNPDWWFGWTDDSAAPNTPVAGDRYAAFHWDNGTFKFETSDGTTVQTTSSISITLGRINTLAIWRRGSDILGFVNGVLVATHGTNIPNNGGSVYGFYFGTTASSSITFTVFHPKLGLLKSDYAPS